MKRLQGRLSGNIVSLMFLTNDSLGVGIEVVRFREMMIKHRFSNFMLNDFIFDLISLSLSLCCIKMFSQMYTF